VSAAHSVADAKQLDWINAVFELCQRKLGNSTGPNMDDVQHSGKLFVLIKLIEAATASHERVIVFTRWQLTLDIIASALKIHLPNVIFRRLDGQTTDRAAILSEFKPQSTSSSQVLLVSTSCGAEGINLCGASRVVLFGVNWNPNDDLQAAQRV
jgi:DNA excision repair protein ERCC-6